MYVQLHVAILLRIDIYSFDKYLSALNVPVSVIILVARDTINKKTT